MSNHYEYPSNVSDHRAMRLMMDLEGVKKVWNGDARITLTDDDAPMLVGFLVINPEDDSSIRVYVYTHTQWLRRDDSMAEGFL